MKNFKPIQIGDLYFSPFYQPTFNFKNPEDKHYYVSSGFIQANVPFVPLEIVLVDNEIFRICVLTSEGQKCWISIGKSYLPETIKPIAELQNE